MTNTEITAQILFSHVVHATRRDGSVLPIAATSHEAAVATAEMAIHEADVDFVVIAARVGSSRFFEETDRWKKTIIRESGPVFRS